MLDVGVKLAVPNARTVCYVEIEAFPCEVLVSRMEEGHLDDAPVWTNLKTFDGNPWRGKVDCIIGGYPCQPFSLSGKRKGANDPRHLWPHILRIISEVRPQYCFFENVPGHLTLGYDEVKFGLETAGYTVTEGLFSAEEVGAPHRRQRLFILGYAKSTRLEGKDGIQRAEGLANRCNKLADSNLCRRFGLETERNSGQSQPISECGSKELGYYYKGLEGRDGNGQPSCDKLPTWPPSPSDRLGWERVLSQFPALEPAVQRVVDGVDTNLDTSPYAYRRERLSAVGNGVVSGVAAYAFSILSNEIGDDK